MSNKTKCSNCGYEFNKGPESKCPRCGAIVQECRSCSGNCLKCNVNKK